MYEQIIYAVVGAVAYGVAGYLKNTPLETFDLQKFASTVIIGLAIGGISVYYNINYDAAAQMALSAGLTAIVENIIKAIFRRVTITKKVETAA